MAFFSFNPTLFLLIISLRSLSLFTVSVANSFCGQDIDTVWGNEQIKKYDDDTEMTLSLDTNSGSGFQSVDSYLWGSISIEMKLIPNNSAGTICTYYMASSGQYHDEADFEFLGNISGQPYIVHTNLFANGLGEKEVQFYLWFDPTADFHTYTFLWNPRHLAFLVDDIPLRDFLNHEDKGLYFPNHQPMNVHGSIWDGDGWATMGGRVKTDSSQSPFTVSYRNFNPEACVSINGSLGCNLPDGAGYSWFNQVLNQTQKDQIQWVRKNFLVYDYCTDVKRWPNGLPLECTLDPNY